MITRAKKEEQRRHRERRAGLTPEQIAEVDAQEKREAKIAAAVERLHHRMFPEEYQEMGWDVYEFDLADRNGSAFTDAISDEERQKRAEIGVEPFAAKSASSRASSWEWIENKVAELGPEKASRLVTRIRSKLRPAIGS